MPQFTPSPEQLAILAHHSDRHARILAGPGTGKSATLVALTDRLLSGQHPLRMKLLTFTRAATGELAKKVSAHPTAAAERPSTIHSFAISVLLSNPGIGHFPKPLRVADDWEKDQIVYPTLARRIGVQKRRLADLFLEMAANFESLTAEQSPRVNPAERARFLADWQEHRKIFGYTLLAELPYALRCALLEHPHLTGMDYDLLVVDEYQDLNACDLEVLRLLATRRCSIIGAGDDDQSIYSFRRAAPEGIRRFPSDYPGCADYPLSVTHRCGSKIIEWATFVIEGDANRQYDKARLRPAPGSPPGEVALLSFKGHISEARGIAKLVRRLIRDESVSPSEILILLRTDYLGAFSKPIKESLEALGIIYSDPGLVQKLLGATNNRQLLAALRLLVHRADSLAWATLLKLRSGVGDRFVDYIYDGARREGTQFGDALLRAYSENFPGAPRVSVNRAKVLVASILEWIDEHPIPEESTEGWGQWILNTAGLALDSVPAPSPELREILISLDKHVEPNCSLRRYLGQINPLAADLAQTESKGVRIMTMAASKGLTVEASIVAGLERGLVPRPDADASEERRLLYVAMTRSKRFLFGTWARRRQGPAARVGGARTAERRYPTRFLDGGPVVSQDGETYLSQLVRRTRRS